MDGFYVAFKERVIVDACVLAPVLRWSIRSALLNDVSDLFKCVKRRRAGITTHSSSLLFIRRSRNVWDFLILQHKFTNPRRYFINCESASGNDTEAIR